MGPIVVTKTKPGIRCSYERNAIPFKTYNNDNNNISSLDLLSRNKQPTYGNTARIYTQSYARHCSRFMLQLLFSSCIRWIENTTMGIEERERERRDISSTSIPRYSRWLYASEASISLRMVHHRITIISFSGVLFLVFRTLSPLSLSGDRILKGRIVFPYSSLEIGTIFSRFTPHHK